MANNLVNPNDTANPARQAVGTAVIQNSPAYQPVYGGSTVSNAVSGASDPLNVGTQGVLSGVNSTSGNLNAAGQTPQQAAAQAAAVTAMIKSGQYGQGDTAWLKATQAYAAQQAAQGSANFTIAGLDWQKEVDERNAGIENSISGAGGRGVSGGGAGAGAGAGEGAQSGNSSTGGLFNGGNGTLTGGASGSSPAVNASLGQYPSGTPSYQAPDMSYQAPGQGGVMQMQQSSPQNALQSYYNTPGYQLLGNNQAQQFQASPGYQYAVDQAMNQVQQSASARGLLESGAALRGMTDRAQGMASQEYNNWWNQQSQLYGDYQNRLQGLAGGSTGADQAYNLGQTLGGNAMQTGSNLGSLFGSQGNAGLSGMAAAGGAQANNIIGAGTQQAQVNASNQATQLAGAIASQPQKTGLF